MRFIEKQLAPVCQASGPLSRNELLCFTIAELSGNAGSWRKYPATEPQVVDAFNRLRRQDLILYQGDAVTVVDRAYPSFVLQNPALDLKSCMTILQDELEVVLPYGTVETVPMQLGRPEGARGG